VAQRLGLGRAIRLGRGEERTGGGRKPSLLADALEALVAAVYLDGGVRAVRACVRRQLGAEIREARESEQGGAADPKTRLQELVQARLHQTPRYRIVSRTGPDHELQFVADVAIGREVLGRGSGSNRKRAERAAALAALARLDRTED
jgi:ribonuclease-3